jgi:uncharacterized protein (TIGR02268 family)
MLELYVAANNLTTVAFNGPLDRDSLVVDRTRFKWVDVGDRVLTLEPFADLNPGERLIMQVGFKDKALPAKAVIAVMSKAEVVDGKVEVDRRANTSEALLSALAQKDAELEELKSRCASGGPVGLMLAGWLAEGVGPVHLEASASSADVHGVGVRRALGYEGKSSVLIAIWLRNRPGQKPWVPAQALITSATAATVKVLSVQMRQPQPQPGEEGLVVVEVSARPWEAGKTFSLSLMDTSGEHRLSINLILQH